MAFGDFVAVFENQTATATDTLTVDVNSTAQRLGISLLRFVLSDWVRLMSVYLLDIQILRPRMAPRFA